MTEVNQEKAHVEPAMDVPSPITVSSQHNNQHNDGENGADTAFTPLPGLLGSIARTLNALPPEGLAIAFVVSIAAAVLLPNLGPGFFDCWEGHYGEVAREMLARNDYLYPHWKSAYFFSKPVLLFWLMALGFNVVGAGVRTGPLPEYTELAARLPVALIALFAVVAVYLAMARVFNRRAGVFSAIVLVATPFWSMMARQAITDMPYVGLMTAGIAFFMISQFAEGYAQSRWYQRISPWVLGFFAVSTLPQYYLIIRSVKWLDAFNPIMRYVVFGVTALMIAALIVLLYRRGKDSALMMFYILVALATLGKGVAGFALPGLVILSYLIVSRDWSLLRRAQIPLGALLFVLVAFPWYVVLSLFNGRDDESKMFYQRFWVHDTLNRVALGVHGEKGSFDYFIRQLGFGTLSWAAVMPVALFDALRQPMSAKGNKQDLGRIFVAVWAVVMFVFFTAMQTKFHHYILPAVPPLAMVAGLWLAKIWDSGKLPSGLLLAAMLLVTMLVAVDGVREPWAFIDLYTYHYIQFKPEEYFPKHFPFSLVTTWITVIGLGMAICVLLYGWYQNQQASLAADTASAPTWISKLLSLLAPLTSLPRRFGGLLCALVGGSAGRGFVASMVVLGLATSIFMTQVYWQQLAPHWTQRYLFDTYWSERQSGEPVIVYNMQWRGETFYALNTEEEIKDASKLKTRLKEPGRAFIVVESRAFKGLKSTLSEFGDKVKVVDRSNSKWYLVRVDD